MKEGGRRREEGGRRREEGGGRKEEGGRRGRMVSSSVVDTNPRLAWWWVLAEMVCT